METICQKFSGNYNVGSKAQRLTLAGLTIYTAEIKSDNCIKLHLPCFTATIGLNELGCEIGGRRLEQGQVFQPSCAWLCQCQGGGLTCVPLCSDDLQIPPDPCPSPQLLRLPGRCCKEWVCGSLDNSISSNPSAAGNGPESSF